MDVNEREEDSDFVFLLRKLSLSLHLERLLFSPIVAFVMLVDVGLGWLMRLKNECMAGALTTAVVLYKQPSSLSGIQSSDAE